MRLQALEQPLLLRSDAVLPTFLHCNLEALEPEPNTWLVSFCRLGCTASDCKKRAPISLDTISLMNFTCSQHPRLKELVGSNFGFVVHGLLSRAPCESNPQTCEFWPLHLSEWWCAYDIPISIYCLLCATRHLTAILLRMMITGKRPLALSQRLTGIGDRFT